MMSDVKPFGGAETYVTLLVRYLDREVFAPRVVVPREGPMNGKIREAGVPVDVMSLVRAQDLRNLPAFVGYLRSHGVRLINAHGVRAGLFSGLARKRLPVKVAVTEHNLQEWRGKMIPRMIDRFIAKNNDIRVTVSKAVANGMVASGACGPEMIEVIPTAVETARFVTDDARRAAARARFGVPQDALLIAAAGRLHRMKGFIDLVGAAPKIAAAVPKARIIIGGDGEERENLERRVRELGVESVVSMPGYLSDVPELYAAADLFALPSVELEGAPREGMPMVILEAMAAGCAIVTTSVSGNTEIVRDDFNGRIAPQQDPAGLADAIIAVLNDPQRPRFGANGRRFVEEHHSIERVAGQYGELFLRLIESR
jgi:glycosyltransferase involved in cell wall biosynthesis